MPLPTLIRIGGEVFEVVAESPAGSVFLLNRQGLQRQRIEDLETQLVAARAELARVERDAIDVDAVTPLPGSLDADSEAIDDPREDAHSPQADATGSP